MTILALIENEYAQFEKLARGDEREACAVGYVAPAGRRAGIPRFVAREFREVPAGAYASRGPSHAVLGPHYCMHVANRARAEDCGVVLAHTHVGHNSHPTFSFVDNAGEVPLREYFALRAAGENFALVVAASGARCRPLGANASAEIQLIGEDVRRAAEVATEPRWSESHDRQVRAFGAEGQAVLSNLRVAIVGVGGTGSVIAQELAYLGVRHYLLVDLDTVEESNLNRLVGASRADVGRAKTEVAKRLIRLVNPNAEADSEVGDITSERVARRLLEVDFIFLCTDSHASRAVVNQLSYQYLIPCIDMGLGIYVRNGQVTHVAGRVQMLAPGLPCLVCTGAIDSDEVRREMMSDEQRRRDPYFVGQGVPQPAVVSLNASVSSLAVTMFLAATTAMPSNPRMLIYDAIRGTVRPTVMKPQEGCIVCSYQGALARGETWTLPTRADGQLA